MRPEQVFPLRIRVDLGVMAELELHSQMQFFLGGGLTPLQGGYS